MGTWFELLPMSLQAITEFKDPDVEIRPGETVLGDMSDMNKRLLTLGEQVIKDAEQCQLDAKYCNDAIKKRDLQKNVVELKHKAVILAQLMWTAIKDEMDLWGECVGIRKGFKVVKLHEHGDGESHGMDSDVEVMNIMDFLKKISDRGMGL